MDLGIKGEVAIVTAGSKGLGRASAMSLAKNGCRVCISARNAKELEEAHKMIADATSPDMVISTVADATEQADLDKIFKMTMDKWGQVDILVANCGGPPPGTYQQLKPDDWEKAVKQTHMSFVRACYTVTPHMIERKKGSIVTIQSASVKEPIPILVMSNAIRMANVGLVRSMATELGPQGIRVNCICPGAHATDRFMGNGRAKGIPDDQIIASSAKTIPLRTIGTAEGFGENVAWLASKQASFITGQSILVDGGNAKSPL